MGWLAGLALGRRKPARVVSSVAVGSPRECVEDSPVSHVSTWHAYGRTAAVPLLALPVGSFADHWYSLCCSWFFWPRVHHGLRGAGEAHCCETVPSLQQHYFTFDLRVFLVLDMFAFADESINFYSLCRSSGHAHAFR